MLNKRYNSLPSKKLNNKLRFRFRFRSWRCRTVQCSADRPGGGVSRSRARVRARAAKRDTSQYVCVVFRCVASASVRYDMNTVWYGINRQTKERRKG